MKKSLYTQRGVAAVEMGLVPIPVVVPLFGITAFGRAFYLYNTIAKALHCSTYFADPYRPNQRATCEMHRGKNGTFHSRSRCAMR